MFETLSAVIFEICEIPSIAKSKLIVIGYI